MRFDFLDQIVIDFYFLDLTNNLFDLFDLFYICFNFLVSRSAILKVDLFDRKCACSDCFDNFFYLSEVFLALNFLFDIIVVFINQVAEIGIFIAFFFLKFFYFFGIFFGSDKLSLS